MTSFPGAIKTFPTLVDYVDWVLALHQNERGNEITALETSIYDERTDTKDPTGFVDPDAVAAAMTYDSATQKITVTGTFYYYWRGVKKSIVNFVSDAHDNVTGYDYYLYSTDGDTFVWSTDAWDWPDLQLAEVNYQTGYKYGLPEPHGLMPWQAHEEFHQAIGTYKESGGTLDPVSYTLASTTATNRRPNVVAARVHDEDIEHVIAALTSKTYNKMTLSSASAVNFTGLTAEIVPLSTNQPYWNQFTGGAWQQTLMSVGSYMSIWLVLNPVTHDTASEAFRYIWIQGQSEGTLASQQALSPASVSLGDLLDEAPELVFAVQVIIRYIGGNWSITNVVNITGSRFSQVGSPAGAYLSGVSTDGSLAGVGTSADPLSTASGETTASAAGTTTMNVSSASQQELTGTTTHIHKLPVASTLRLGRVFVFINNSTGAWTIQSSGANEVVVIPAGEMRIIRLILASGTTAASWEVDVASGGSGGSTQLVSNEVPGGSVNGSNVDFTTTGDFITGSLKVYLNGQRLKGGGVDYTEGTSGFAMVTAPFTGDLLLVDYYIDDGATITGSTSFVYNETPSGTVNGVNTVFSLASSPVSGSVQLFKNGILQKSGVGNDYTISGADVTFTTAPATGSVLLAHYESDVSTAGNADTLDGQHGSYYLDPANETGNGWMALSGVFTYNAADSPTFVMNTPSDLTAMIGLGMKIKLTQTTVKYFIVTAIDASTITMYGGTDYTLANAAISDIYFSREKSPFGFPQSIEKWAVLVTASNDPAKATPTGDVIYGDVGLSPTGPSIVIPIGVWRVFYKCVAQATDSTVGVTANGVKVSISTSASAHDALWQIHGLSYLPATTQVYRIPIYVANVITRTTKVTYYLVISTGQAGIDSIGFLGSQGSLILKAECAYL